MAYQHRKAILIKMSERPSLAERIWYLSMKRRRTARPRNSSNRLRPNNTRSKWKWVLWRSEHIALDIMTRLRWWDFCSLWSRTFCFRTFSVRTFYVRNLFAAPRARWQDQISDVKDSRNRKSTFFESKKFLWLLLSFCTLSSTQKNTNMFLFAALAKVNSKCRQCRRSSANQTKVSSPTVT